MELRLTRPTTVAAALKPFNTAVADLKYVLAKKRDEASDADADTARAQKTRDNLVKTADQTLARVTKTNEQRKTTAEAEIAQAETALGKISDILGTAKD